MVFKENRDESPIKQMSASQEGAEVKRKAAPLSEPGNDVAGEKRAAAPDPAKKRGLNCRTEKDAYVIEPIKRPKSKRFLATVAVMLAAFLLTGSVFYYGGAVLGNNNIQAVSSNLSGQKKTGSDKKENAVTVSGEPKLVSLRAISVEKDMSVRFLGDDGYPIGGHPFEIEVTDPDGGVETYADDDQDGRIYLSEIDGGEYGVEMLPIEGFIVPEPLSVEVRDKVEYKKIDDIEDKINSMKDINAAADDPQYGNTGNSDAGTGTPSVIEPQKDTVEFVESRVEEKNGTTRYTGNIGEGGRLFAKDGTLSNIIPEVVNGYLTGTYTLYKEPVVEPVPEPTPEGGDIDLFGKDAGGNFIYDVTPHTEKVKVYYGWQDIDGKRYYFDKNGSKVTGSQVIQGKSYTFDSSGVMQAVSNKMLGIDISTWQNTINWNRVKAAGVEFVMIRAGFRGYGTGKIVEDDLFYTNLKGATAAGLRVGVYFFSQAINEVEGVEEASMVLSLLQKYGIRISYPITIDSEWSGASGNSGRADNLSRAQRTAVCVAFCETVKNAGYTPMIYASKSWFESNLNVGSFGGYKIWLAHYTPGGATSSYTGRYEMWQYTSQGAVDGISGNVDMNYGYLGY